MSDKKITEWPKLYLYLKHTHAHTAPDDYTAVPQNDTVPVVFATGHLSTTIFIHIINDSNIESDESFFGRLRSKNLQLVTVTEDRAEIVIRDDDCKF